MDRADEIREIAQFLDRRGATECPPKQAWQTSALPEPQQRKLQKWRDRRRIKNKAAAKAWPKRTPLPLDRKTNIEPNPVLQGEDVQRRLERQTEQWLRKNDPDRKRGGQKRKHRRAFGKSGIDPRHIRRTNGVIRRRRSADDIGLRSAHVPTRPVVGVDTANPPVK